ncbi:MAG: GNAT family N-acetyltransferase [Promethearchaeota archaeon]|jgi:ribosomal protein S18 acetylase RimI-like enzyme
MKIRSVTLDDLNEVMDLEHKVFKENAFSKKLMESLISSDTFFLKIEHTSKKYSLVGFIIAIRDREDQVNIINFLIDPKYQNKGYGTLLFKETLNLLHKVKGIRKIVLNVQVSNSRAINLYKKFNFRKNPREIKNYYQSGESAFFMELNLDSP